MPTVAALFDITVAMEVIGTSEFNDLKGCPKTFCQYSLYEDD